MKSIIYTLLFFVCFSCSKNNTNPTNPPIISKGKCYDTIDKGNTCSAYWENWFYDESIKNCIKKSYSGCEERGCKTFEECRICSGLGIDTSQTNHFLILKIDYLTNQFEGGKEYVLKGPKDLSSKLDISSIYTYPTDEGSVRFLYNPMQKELFWGSIMWMGSGRIGYPTFEDASKFNRLTSTISLPNFRVKSLEPHFISDRNISKLWPAIENLEIVKDYASTSKEIGLTVYTPNVGKTDTSKAKWIVIFQKTN